jgi:uncharacterized protein (DUF608 family)
LLDLNRREFLQTVAGLAMVGAWGGKAVAAESAPLTAPPAGGGDYPVLTPRTYTGANLEYVLMPLGGIGTGTIWIDGQGRLAVWQIFNNFTENRIPDSFFAVRAQAAGQEPVVRVLQTTPEPWFEPVESLTFEGGYPIARLRFTEPDLPVALQVEAFNPMIPLDTTNSSLPCAIFRITARNEGTGEVEVSILGTLQNAVGSQGQGGIDGVRFGGYGRNRNRLVREDGLTALLLERPAEPPAAGRICVRSRTGAEVPELLWMDTLMGPADAATAGPEATALIETMARLARDGGGIVAAGVQPAFFEAVRDTQEKVGRWKDMTILADFEDGTYQGWTVHGEAFGNAPHTGTSPNQQPVSGFFGKYLVNTFVPHDGPQGELISDPFRIEKKFLGFLIGGGNHPGETCINLRVGGQVVRTATGRDNERLEPRSWDVAEFLGQEATLEIIDHHSGGWGHINIDHIVCADVSPDRLMRLEGPVEAVGAALQLTFERAELATLPEGSTATLAADAGRQGGVALPAPQSAIRNPQSAIGLVEPWKITVYTRLVGFRPGEGYTVLATAPNGDPLLIEGPLGEARVALCLAPNLPWSWAQALLVAARGQPLAEGERLVTGAPGFGTMALSTPEEATSTAGWTDSAELAGQFQRDGRLAGPDDSGESPTGQTFNGALAVPFTLRPGEERTATFVVSWHFPNVDRFGHPGNEYSLRFPDALAVARHAATNAGPLWERTKLYHDTVYQSNLPPLILDAMTSQSVIFRGPTAWRSEEGYFGGFEGAYGCCPLNCTHVWNYAQSHARLFPEIGRNMRESDLLRYLHENGETSHRQHAPHNAFIDGHCATIEAAYREYQLSPDRAFLDRVWPNLKKAVDWLIEAIDADHDGVPAGHQWNTYDCAVSGANTFIGSQYLSALAAAERMAEVEGEPDTAARWRAIREAGMKNQVEQLWNGEYYFQIPGPQPANDYHTGCHSDQLLGQWWAHQLGLGLLYPPEQIRTALGSIMRHNFREKFAGFEQRPRRYIPDDEGGLLMCTWPQGGRPDPFIIYADEVWTGIEYATAALMIYEGLLEPALKIVDTARGRYDGRKRDGLNSGPGGNPFNELECGKFYARAMSSWSLLLACQGLILEGPAGRLGFQPRWQPENHRSFFTAPEGWGLFVQQREGNTQTDRIEVRSGRLRVRELTFAVLWEARPPTAEVRVGERAVPFTLQQEGSTVRLTLNDWLEVPEGAVLEVTLRGA